MEEPTVTRQRLSRYTSKQITEYIKHWRKSGLSKKAFCESNNINYYTFVGWTVHKKKKKATPASINSFIPVKVRENAISPFAEVYCANGSRIIFHDANGIVNVSAKDKATGKSQHVRIEASSGLSDAEIKRMKEEAAANADSDKKAKEEIDKINSADALIFQSDKQLKDYGDKLSADKKEAITKALDGLKEAHKAKDLARIDVTMGELNTAWQAASEEMYKATQAAQPGADGANAGPQADGGAPGADGKKEGEVTDVDFEEVKDDKK